MEKQVLTKDIITIVKYLILIMRKQILMILIKPSCRTVGEQLSQQFGVGLARMARTIRENER
jgi:DNA-directed RNA polymerase subunit beta